jgi:hypothetical protein
LQIEDKTSTGFVWLSQESNNKDRGKPDPG